MPPNVGLRGKGTSVELATLQMHYNNPNHLTGIVDDSGVELSLTTELREHDMTTMMMDCTDQFDPSRPAKQAASLRVEAHVVLAASVKKFSTALHAHQAGVYLEAWHMRNGNVIGSLGAAPTTSTSNVSTCCRKKLNCCRATSCAWSVSSTPCRVTHAPGRRRVDGRDVRHVGLPGGGRRAGDRDRGASPRPSRIRWTRGSSQGPSWMWPQWVLDLKAAPSAPPASSRLRRCRLRLCWTAGALASATSTVNGVADALVSDPDAFIRCRRRLSSIHVHLQSQRVDACVA